ncbi:TetR/AcrR family transcriptional regulator [Comamonadaceae bacterium PP-2]
MNDRLPPEIAPDVGHRTRVGAQRRGRTRIKLIESSLTVFVAKGPDMAVIDDFIAAAGVSRGTFYNHFRTTHELMLAVAAGMSDEVLHVIEPYALARTDPLERFSVGSRLYLREAVRYPIWGAFIARVGTHIAARGQPIDIHLRRDVSDAIVAQRLDLTNVQVGRDLLLGALFYGIETCLKEETAPDHAELLVERLLVGLGLPVDEARRIGRLPLPDLEPLDGPIFSRLEPRLND